MIIEDEYVKQSYLLSWAFFSQNVKVSLIVISTLFGLALLSLSPLIGIISLLLLSIISFSVQIYVAKDLLQSQDRNEFYKSIKQMEVKDILLKYFKIGVGAFLGQLSIEILLAGLFYLIFSSLIGMETYSAVVSGGLAHNEIYSVYVKIGFIFAVSLLFFMAWIYIVPMMLAYAYEAQSLGEAFRAAFVIFNRHVWKASFKEKYFVLISMLQVSALIAFSLMALFFANVYLIPLAIFIAYLFLIYLALLSAMAKEAVT